MKNLILDIYHPRIKITEELKIEDLINYFDKNNFNMTENEEDITYFGKVFLIPNEEMFIHFRITKNLRNILSIMLSYFLSDEKTLYESFNKKQQYLNNILNNSFNKKNNIKEDDYYFYWEYPNYKIEHFIKDRYGKMEGIFVEFFNVNKV